jgi:hypothetical protein
VKNGPDDAGELVGKRNRRHVVVQALPGSLDPRLKPVAVPMLWPDLDQHDGGEGGVMTISMSDVLPEPLKK